MMKISAKTDYACRAVLELSKYQQTQELVRVDDIATRQTIPKKYLVQILLQLQRAGIARSKRGAAGGYYLAKPAREISLGDVMRGTGGPLLSLEYLKTVQSNQNPASHLSLSVLKEIWLELRQTIENIVDEITFEEILRRVEQKSTMYYI